MDVTVQTLDAAALRAWLESAGVAIRERRDYLTQLDAAIGDADHGANMDRGFGAVGRLLEIRDADASAGALLLAAGSTLTANVGGASGALWGTALRCAGDALGDASEVDAAGLARALQAALDGIVEIGAAEVGDKTMVDALDPVVRALHEHVAAGTSLGEAIAAARAAGDAGVRATVPLKAAKGRASYLGERSIGHQDPGATSAMIIIAALEQTVALAA